MARVQLSLLNVILIVTALAGLAGVYATFYRQRQLSSSAQVLRAELDVARAEYARIREQFGVLRVDDASRLHALLAEDDRPLSWTYHVYLPEGRSYYAACRVNRLPIDGQLPEFEGLPPNASTIKTGAQNEIGVGLISGEYRITITVHAENEQPRFSINCRSIDGASSGGRGGSQIVHSPDQWPTQQHSFAVGGVSRTTQIVDPDQTLVLLDARSFGIHANNSSESTEGVIAWIHSTP